MLATKPVAMAAAGDIGKWAATPIATPPARVEFWRWQISNMPSVVVDVKLRHVATFFFSLHVPSTNHLEVTKVPMIEPVMDRKVLMTAICA